MSKAGRAFLPLMLLWLAVHAVILAAILSLKFLGAKIVALLLLVCLTLMLVVRAGRGQGARRLAAGI